MIAHAGRTGALITVKSLRWVDASAREGDDSRRASRRAASCKREAQFRFARDSPLEGTGFEPVWGFSCQVSFSFGAGSLFGAGKPFFVPSPAIRFAERAERGQGTETVAKLGGLPLSGACVSQRLRPEYAER